MCIWHAQTLQCSCCGSEQHRVAVETRPGIAGPWSRAVNCPSKNTSICQAAASHWLWAFGNKQNKTRNKTFISEQKCLLLKDRFLLSSLNSRRDYPMTNILLHWYYFDILYKCIYALLNIYNTNTYFQSCRYMSA